MRSLSLVLVLVSACLMTGCNHKQSEGSVTGKPPCQGGYCPNPSANAPVNPVLLTTPAAVVPSAPIITPGSDLPPSGIMKGAKK